LRSNKQPFCFERISERLLSNSRSCQHTGVPFDLQYETGDVTGEIVHDIIMLGGKRVSGLNIGAAKMVSNMGGGDGQAPELDG
jgi:hypothetical protein